jgi:peroxiredoxin
MLSFGQFEGDGMIRRLLLALALIFAIASPTQARAPKVGEPAPDFQLTLVNGTKVSLADLRGQVVVINFWATWCGPCKRELPTLDAYYVIQKHLGLRVFAATTEDSVPEHSLHVLFDRMTIEPVHRLKGPYQPLGGVPTNFVIDRAGVVRYAKAGAFDLDLLNEVLVPLLREPAPPAPPTVAAAASRRAGA